MPDEFHELIYCEDRANYDALRELVMHQFPAAKIEDGSDDIHQYRFEVTGEGEQDDFFRFAIKNGFAMQGLHFNLDLRMHTDRIKRLMEEVKGIKL